MNLLRVILGLCLLAGQVLSIRSPFYSAALQAPAAGGGTPTLKDSYSTDAEMIL